MTNHGGHASLNVKEFKIIRKEKHSFRDTFLCIDIKVTFIHIHVHKDENVALSEDLSHTHIAWKTPM